MFSNQIVNNCRLKLYLISNIKKETKTVIFLFQYKMLPRIVKTNINVEQIITFFIEILRMV